MSQSRASHTPILGEDEFGAYMAPPFPPWPGERWRFDLHCDCLDAEVDSFPNGVEFDGGWWTCTMVKEDA